MASAVSHPVFARAFPAMSRALEAGGIARHHMDLLAGLAGQVIDIGAVRRVVGDDRRRRRRVCTGRRPCWLTAPTRSPRRANRRACRASCTGTLPAGPLRCLQRRSYGEC